jgi:hypothetical protein
MLPRAARIKIATPALLLLVSQTRAVSTGDPVKDFGRAGIIFGFVVKFIDFGLLRQDGDLYKLKDRDGAQAQSNSDKTKNGSSKEESMTKNKSLWQKFKDSAELWLFTMRGIGWNWQVGGIPEREPQSTK